MIKKLKKPSFTKPFNKLKEQSGAIKLGKLKRPSLTQLRRLGGKRPDLKISQAIENLPRITNETVAEHREEMLHSARKFIYPLKHTRTRIVKVSVSLFIAVMVLFVGYVLVSLYKLQASSTFIYGVTRVVPLPVARADNAWISYESYLFELRHFKHYYETQQQVDFKSESGRAQLAEFKRQAIDQVTNDAYVKQLAASNNVTVSGQEVDDAVGLLREQNRLGNNDREFADVLKEFWGWSTDDFRRELRQQLLAQKVVAKLDTTTSDRSQAALAAIQNGTDFATVAKQYSDDVSTKDANGEYTFLIDRNNRDVPPKVVDELFKLQPGETSKIIDTGYTLEIVKVLAVNDGKVRAAHVAKNYQNIATFIKPLKDQNPPKTYIKL